MNRKINIFLILAVIFLIFTPKKGAAQLQELEINPITNDGPIPVFRDYPDLAAIFVQSSLNNLSFESNLEIVEEMGNPATGEYILLVQPVRQSIRVNVPGFIQSRIQLRNLEERDVIYYSIEPHAITEGETVPVVFRINPPHAEVFVDNQPVDATSSVPLEPGLHSIELALEGYHNLEQQIEVSNDSNFFELYMQEIEPVPVRIQTDPPGASVFVNGVRQAETDPVGVLDFFHFPGNLELQLSLDGYVTQRDTVQVRENEKNIYSFNLAKNIGTINLQINPEEAEVELNGNSITPNQPIEVEPGNYNLRVSLDRYKSYEEELNIGLGETIERSITLQMNTGTLNLDISPAEADVFVNKQEFDHRQPIYLAPGMYRLEVSLANYESHQQNIQIKREETTEESISLTPHTGSLFFTVSPSFAVASLFNNFGELVDQWTGIRQINNLKVGNYQIDVKADEYRSQIIDINIQKDQRYEASVTLEEGSDCPEKITDIDENIYPIVDIGNQCWMAENLKTTKYANGNKIGTIVSNSNWQETISGAWTFYNDDSNFDEHYGKLYNWYAVDDSRNLCPRGWHVPSDSEWIVMEEYLGLSKEIANTEGWRGSDQNVGLSLKANLKRYWGVEYISASTNRARFSALPGGYKTDTGFYLYEGLNGYWWTSSYQAYIRKLGKVINGINREILPKNSGLSVRCIMN